MKQGEADAALQEITVSMQVMCINVKLQTHYRKVENGDCPVDSILVKMLKKIKWSNQQGIERWRKRVQLVKKGEFSGERGAAPSVLAFKWALKTYLFRAAFNDGAVLNFLKAYIAGFKHAVCKLLPLISYEYSAAFCSVLTAGLIFLYIWQVFNASCTESAFLLKTAVDMCWGGIAHLTSRQMSYCSYQEGKGWGGCKHTGKSARLASQMCTHCNDLPACSLPPNKLLRSRSTSMSTTVEKSAWISWNK